MYLPLMAKTETSSLIERQEDAPTDREHILLVDDETAIARLEKQMLERLGYQVTMCLSSLEAPYRS